MAFVRLIEWFRTVSSFVFLALYGATSSLPWTSQLIFPYWITNFYSVTVMRHDSQRCTDRYFFQFFKMYFKIYRRSPSIPRMLSGSWCIVWPCVMNSYSLGAGNGLDNSSNSPNSTNGNNITSSASSQPDIKQHFVTREGYYKNQPIYEYSRPQQSRSSGGGGQQSMQNNNIGQGTQQQQQNLPVKISMLHVTDDETGCPERILFNVGREMFIYAFRSIWQVCWSIQTLSCTLVRSTDRPIDWLPGWSRVSSSIDWLDREINVLIDWFVSSGALEHVLPWLSAFGCITSELFSFCCQVPDLSRPMDRQLHKVSAEKKP